MLGILAALKFIIHLFKNKTTAKVFPGMWVFLNVNLNIRESL